MSNSSGARGVFFVQSLIFLLFFLVLAMSSLTISARAAESEANSDDGLEAKHAGHPHSTDLSISKAGAPNPVIVGNVLTYTLVARNLGPDSASNVVVVDILPSTVALISSTPAVSSQVGGNLGFNIGNLAAGASRQITITVRAKHLGIVTNRASIKAAGPDTNPGNNSVTVATEVVSALPSLDLALALSGSPASVAVGQSITYSLRCRNVGSATATGVVVSDTLPAGVTLTSANPAPSSRSGNVLKFNFASIAPGATRQITIVVKPGAPGVVTNRASVTSNGTDANPANNSATVNTTVRAQNSSRDGGPVILMGIDAEDGGPGGHGPISSYVQVVTGLRNQVTNGGNGILVIGGNKNANDNVTVFWNAIQQGTGQAITFVNGATDITARSFAGFAIIAVTSSRFETPGGGLTQEENDALATRQQAVADFVNAGGGLLGFSQSGLTNPYAYIAVLGGFTFEVNQSYDNITSTAEGSALGITDVFDICCWHDYYTTFPAFLTVLARDANNNKIAAIGGVRVTLSDLTISKSSSGAVPTGGNLTYTITYGNIGTATANNVIIREVIPAGATFVSASNGGTLGTGNTITWNIGQVPPNTTGRTVTFVVRVNSTGTSIVNTNYSISATGVPAVTGTPVTTTVIPASLTISKTAVGTVFTGELLTYTLTYGNTGNTGVTGAVIRDTLPPGVTFVSATNGGTLTGNVVTFNIGAIPANTTGRTVSITVQVNATGGSVVNTAYSLAAAGIAAVTGAPVTTTVQQPPCALAAPVVFNAGPVRPIGPYLPSMFNIHSARRFRQAITIHNPGNTRLTGPFSLVIDNLTGGATVVGAAGTTGCAAPLGSAFIGFGAGPDNVLSPGETVTVDVEFTTPTPTRPGEITFTPRVVAGPGQR